MYTVFGSVGFIHANLIQKNYLQKNNSRNIFQKKHMLEAPAIMEVLKKDLIQYCTSRQSSEVWKMHFTRT